MHACVPCVYVCNTIVMWSNNVREDEPNQGKEDNQTQRSHTNTGRKAT